MHCPLCGSVLVEIDRHEGKENPYDKYDPDLDGEELEHWHKLCDEWDNYGDKSVWFKCDGCKLFQPGFPLTFHHPIYGIKAAPGDSWSLSWIK